MEKKYDLAVIGAGPGGYVAALRAAQLGMHVVCIDKRETLGGTCLNVGCIPSKALLQSTELYAHVLKEGKELGLHYTDLGVNFAQMMSRKEKVIQSLVDGIAGLFKQQKITFLQGEAEFIDAHRLVVINSDTQTIIEATYILIATGSEPIPLPFLPFQEDKVVSSTEMLSLKKVPQKLAVIGGGVIGVELASVYNRLGSEVTIVEMLPLICPAMDHTLSKHLLQTLKNQGIVFQLSTQLTHVDSDSEQMTLHLKSKESEQKLIADTLLISIGRRPYTTNLKLDKAGVHANKKGFIPVDALFRTNQSHIFAIGDVIEGVMLAHRASQEGVAVVEWLKGDNSSIDYMTIPNVIYTYPEVASVGMTEQEALEANLDIMIGRSHFKANPRARCADETEGLLKIIGDKKSGRVIGMHIIGPHASELISNGVLAIQQKMTLSQLADTVFAHPTLSESIKEAALAALRKPLHG